jgi:hypothetical protein
MKKFFKRQQKERNINTNTNSRTTVPTAPEPISQFEPSTTTQIPTTSELPVQEVQVQEQQPLDTKEEERLP